MNFVQITWITVAISAIITIFAFRYLKHRENMYLIRKDQFSNKNIDFSGYFSIGIILIGISIAVIFAIIAKSYINTIPTPLIYVMSLSFFCGIALLVCYFYFKKTK